VQKIQKAVLLEKL